VRVDPVTQRYADALWLLAQEKGVLAAVIADVKRLAQSLENPVVRDAITNPRRDRDDRRKTITGAAGALQPLVQNLVGLLFDKGREAVLLELAGAFHALELDAAGQIEGVVESARPLGQTEMDLVATQLGPQFGKKLVLTNKIVPDLVGGARVIAGNRMIDYSVQGRLEALRRRLMDVALPAVRA
jgi:F-type H+-transporting ATPase subunit delta